MTQFIEISSIIALAALMSILMRALRQPLIIGHIITGLIVGPFVLSIVQSTETLELFSQLGIAFLLFVVGIHLSPTVIKKFGGVAVITGAGQVIITTALGWFVARALGFSDLTSLYLATALAFSSTIIILKLISDRGDLDTLYANISIGFLLVQDIIAIGLLFVIPLLATGDTSVSSIAAMVAGGIALIAVIALVAHFALPMVDRFISRSLEMLLLFSVAWGMGIAALFYAFGFAIESGALIAGIALARMPSRFEISSRLTPLRDFFLILFFIVLGSQMKLSGLGEVIGPAIILSLLVLIGNPLILMSLLGFMGYRKKTSLQTGFTVAQISEFSLILIALGVRVGHVEESILSLTTLIALITIFGSTYFILYSEAIYKTLRPYLSVFERNGAKEKRTRQKKYEVVIFGCNRLGFNFLQQFKKLKEKLLIIDHNPDVVERLKTIGVSCEFGDAGDIDFLDSLNLRNARLVISTVPDAETNYLINKTVRSQRSGAFVVVVAHNVEDALDHYENGANYVIVPHMLGGEYAAKIVKKFTKGDKNLEHLRKKHIESLSNRLENAHAH